MPHYKCRQCHHEWDGEKKQAECDWCHTPNAIILEKETSLEKFIGSLLCLQKREEE